jgi:hypothetical protein
LVEPVAGVVPLAAWWPGDYHRFSMIGVASVKASPAGIPSFAIIAPTAR